MGLDGLSVYRLVWVACADKPINLNGQSLEMGLVGGFIGLSVGLGGLRR